MVRKAFSASALLRGFCALIVTLGSLLAAPDARAQCSAAADSSNSNVRFSSCTYGEAPTANANRLDIAYPASTAAGDVLVLVLAIKAEVGAYNPPGFARIMTEIGGGATLAIFRRIADGNELGNLRVNWTGNRFGQAFMMRVVNATGRFETDWVSSTNSSLVKSSNLSSGFTNQLVLRVAAMPGDEVQASGSIIKSGSHKGIIWNTHPNLGTSPTNAITLAAAYDLQAGEVSTGEATFNNLTNSSSLTATVAFEFGADGLPTGDPSAFVCGRNSDALTQPSQIVIFRGCRKQTASTTSGASSITIEKPSDAQVGDILLAMISAGTDEIPPTPTGWTSLLYSKHKNDLGGGEKGASYVIYKRAVTLSEPSNYTFSFSDVRGIAGLISAFGNADLAISVSSRTETGESMLSPSASTTRPNSLVVRTMASDDQDIGNQPSEIVPYYRNIAAIDSQAVDRGVSLQAAYHNVATPGPVRDERMYLLQDEESTLATLVISPIINYQLGFTMPDTLSDSCGSQAVTLTVRNGSGNVLTNFAGTVNLSVQAASSGLYSGASWQDLDSSLNGILTSGSNGVASYTFSSADNGVAVFDFLNPNAGTVNFNATYTDPSTGQLITESTSLDPNLTISACTVKVTVADNAVAACSAGTDVTYEIFRGNGTKYTNYDGLLIVTANGTGNYSYSDTPSLSGGFINLGSNDGVARYQFSSSNNGEVTLKYSNTTPATVNLDAYSFVAGIMGGVSTANSVVISDCTFRITYTDAITGGTTCAAESVSMGIYDDANGSRVTDFVGTMTVEASSSKGAWSVITGGGTFTETSSTDGDFSYAFTGADAGQATFAYSTLDTGDVNFNVTSGTFEDARNSSNTYDQNLSVGNCVVQVTVDTPSNEGDMCSIEPITFTITNAAGARITHFAGTLSIATSSGNGDWRGSETNTAVNGTEDDGVATYTFAAADDGNITLGFTHLYEASSVGFTVSAVSTAGRTVAQSTAVNESIEILGCTVFIDVNDGLASACGNGEEVTYTIRDSAGNIADNFEGYLLLDAETGKGDFSSTTANGELDNAILNDGAALYKFTLADNGVLVANYATKIPGTVNLLSSAPSIDLDPASDRSIEFNSCELRITYTDSTPGAAESCSQELVRIGLYDASGTAIVDYDGAITVTTSSGYGDWTVTDGDGDFVDIAAGDGSFVYEFTSTDLGEATFGYTAGVAGTVNFDVDDGIITDARDATDPFDANLDVSACGFQISFDGGGASSFHNPVSMTACSVQEVTIEVVDSSGAALTNYLGLVTITNSSRRGTWAINDADGTLTALGTDKGSATYQFVNTDNGKITLDFSSEVLGSLSIDVTDGAMVVDPAADPLLTVTGCVPTIGTPSCSGPPNKSAEIAINARQTDPNQRGRLVIMLVADASNSDVSTATFNGVAMTRIHRAEKPPLAGAMLEMWGILDADLPVNAGTYSAAYGGASDDATMCVMFLDSVAQAFPNYNSSTPNAGAVNGTSGTTNMATTTITTPANNSVVVTGVIGAQPDGASTDYGVITPSSLSRIFQGPDPTDADFAGSFGEIANAGELTVTDTRNGGLSDRNVQLVAAFAPLFDSPPVITNYVPLTLQASYAGNIDFDFIGNTMRTSDLVGERCDMGSGTVTAALAPSASPLAFSGSSIVSAWLYWFGAGDYSAQPPGADFDTVTFTNSDGVSTSIDASGIHKTINTFGSGGRHYYTAFKEVTSLMTGRGNYAVSNIDTDTSTAYSNEDLCAAGWAMVVVHSHPQVQYRVVNIYDGLHPIGGSGGTDIAYVDMGNFVTSTPDAANLLPNGHIGFALMEGDIGISDGKESYLIQAAPGSDDFNILTNYYNLNYAALNSTITRLAMNNAFTIADGSKVFSLNETVGEDGYLTDFPGSFTGPTPDTFDATGSAYGVDIDNFHLSPTGASEIGDLFGSGLPASTKGLNAFGNVNATSLRTGVATGNDSALLFAQALSMTSEKVADLEITLSERVPFSVGGEGIYDIQVKINGTTGNDFGSATGVTTVTGILPDGLTFASGASVAGERWSCLVTRTPAAFTCNFDIATDWTTARGAQVSGELGESATTGVGESLPTLSAEVEIADSATFPLLNNSVLIVARLLHSDGTCAAASVGVSPNPTGCSPPEFDNVNFLNDGAIDINDLSEKTAKNNNVDGIETTIAGASVDLKIEVTLEEALNKSIGSSYYSMLVTNLGSSDTTAPFVIIIAKPPGLSFSSLSGAGFTDCVIATTTVTCNYSAEGGLAVGESATLNLVVGVIGDIADVVVTTASVTVGAGDFDPDLTNNTASNASPIVGTEPITQDKFLFSIGTLRPFTGGRGQTKLSNLDSFNDDDLVIYDPSTDTATLFFNDDTGTDEIDLNNIVSAHVLPNGHIVMASSGTSSATGVGTFTSNKLVKYDPIAQATELFFDGSTRFNSGNGFASVYVLSGGDFLFTTTSANSVTGFVWDAFDIVRYDASEDTASVYVTADIPDLFGSDETPNIEGLYFRVSDADPDAISDVLNFTTYEYFSRVGLGGEPPLGTVVTHDDIGQVDLRTGSDTNYSTRNVFRGDANPGIFENATGSIDKDGVRWIDALHIVEDGYIGHFSIAQSAAGSTCEVGRTIISKHEGRTHTVDEDYYGSVIITTSTGTGDWGLVDGEGTLDNGTAGDGRAVYTFVAADAGDVELSLQVTTAASSVDIHVTNGIAEESATEDPVFSFNATTSTFVYLDNFTAASFSHNAGTAVYSGAWAETDDSNGISGSNSGAGVSTGNVTVSSGVLSLKSSSLAESGRDPSVARSANFSAFTVTEAINLNYDYGYVSANSADSVVVEASDDNGANWQLLRTITGRSGNASGLAAPTIRLDTFGGSLNDLSGSLTIRFRVTNGYTSGGSFNIDNVEISAGTTDCNVVSMDHYAIAHDGTGISCLGSDVTIMGHDASHNLIAVPLGESMTLSNNRLKGTWASIISGAGVLTDLGAPGSATNTDGQGNYLWSGSEHTVVLRFNYTDPATDPESVNFDLSGSYFEDKVTASHDDDLSISRAGLRFYTVTGATAGIPTQLSGKASNTGFGAAQIQLQAIRSSDEDPSACVALFPDAEVVDIDFAVECANPSSCSSTTPAQTFAVNGTSLGSALQNTNGLAGAANYQTIASTFADASVGTAVPIVVEYSDAGQVQLHARYNIPFDEDAEGVESGDYLEGSTTFVVRPFGFDIDFDDDRSLDTDDSRAEDASGVVFRKAGSAFETTLTAQRWQAGDDADNDGNPDSDADLSDNGTTPNYGNEIGTEEDDAVVSHTLDLPVAARGSQEGTLSGGALFTTFTGAVSTADLSYSEVGIIDLAANLSDNDYLGSGQDIQGNVQNVGRFIPDHFTLTSASVSPMCTAATDFTYLGEPFPVSFMLEAKNSAGTITQNYHGDFVKLAAEHFAPDSVFHGVQDVAAAADVDLSSRTQSIDSSFGVVFDDFGDASPGVGSIMGTLVVNRENDGVGVDGAPDGPFILRIGTSIADRDGVAIKLSGTDIDVDDGVTEPGDPAYANLTTSPINFRYGRLLLDNAFGPETEDLEIPARIQYFDGTEFVLNTDDSCTTLTFNVSIPPLTIVADSVTAPAGTENPLEAGDTSIEKGVTENFTITLSGGRTGDTNIMSSGSDTDRPFSASAPIGGAVGSAIVELDLGYSSSTDPVDFLTYDWRGGSSSTDPYEQGIPDGASYTNNPRAIIEFGSYRSHDRVLSWRELYVMPEE